MANQKKCKAPSCSNIFDRDKSRPFVTWCCNDCAYEISMVNLKKSREKAAKKAKFEKEAPTRALKEYNRKQVKWQKPRTQDAFNRMRVAEEMLWFKVRGIEPYCISCLRTNVDWCCSHLRSRGAYPELSFDRENTFAGCNRNCNKALSGNLNGDKHSIGFLEGLKHRFGKEEGQIFIDHYKGGHKLKKYTWQDLEDMRAEFNERLREVKRLLI